MLICTYKCGVCRYFVLISISFHITFHFGHCSNFNEYGISVSCSDFFVLFSRCCSEIIIIIINKQKSSKCTQGTYTHEKKMCSFNVLAINENQWSYLMSKRFVRSFTYYNVHCIRMRGCDMNANAELEEKVRKETK